MGESPTDDGNGRDERGDEEDEGENGRIGNEPKCAHQPPQHAHGPPGTASVNIDNPHLTASNALRPLNTIWG
jgi:hypothetical protein